MPRARVDVAVLLVEARKWISARGWHSQVNGSKTRPIQVLNAVLVQTTRSRVLKRQYGIACELMFHRQAIEVGVCSGNVLVNMPQAGTWQRDGCTGAGQRSCIVGGKWNRGHINP